MVVPALLISVTDQGRQRMVAGRLGDGGRDLDP
jgi:hypothetical protein